MRADAARRALATLALGATLSGCALLTRPEGNGGWSAERRRQELGVLADRAGVTLAPDESTPAPPAGEPLDLAAVLALAARQNRSIAVATRQVDAAAARVRDAR